MPAEKLQSRDRIMARVFNGKVEAEIREDCRPSGNPSLLCLSLV
jgi:hypothetical protein